MNLNHFTPVAYFYDNIRKDSLNRQGKNYWDAYLQELMDELGVTAEKCADVNQIFSSQGKRSVLIFGETELSEDTTLKLSEWVNDGGILICFRTHGLDSLLGIEHKEDFLQADDEFTVNGYMRMKSDGYLHQIEEKVLLPVISPILQISKSNAEVIAEMLDPTTGALIYGNSRIFPAILRKYMGSGVIYYYTFSLPQTQYVIHQGRPIDRDWDGDGYYKSADGIVISSLQDLAIPYADYHNLILQRILDSKNIPAIHAIPPEDGKVCDFLVHFGGDDEADPNHIRRKTMEWMISKGLPYHFNIMRRRSEDKGFEVTPRLYDELKKNGMELSIHFDFVRIRTKIRQEEIDDQLNSYEECFGETPIASVNHCMMWYGWAEIPRWCSMRGIKGDNSRINGRVLENTNPINTFGFGFGTAFPHFVYDDFEHGNEKIPFTYIPVMFYEPRVYDETRERDKMVLESVLDNAAKNSWTLNCFYHPVFIANDEACRRAIEETLEYIRQKGYNVVFTGTDGVCLWWHDRSQSSIEVTYSSDDKIIMTVKAAGKDGLVVKIPDRGFEKCVVDEQEITPVKKTISGYQYILIPVATGKHFIVIKK